MIVLVGAGRMGYAMLARWLDDGWEDICVLEPQPSQELLRLHEERFFLLNLSFDDLKQRTIDAAVLAVKPHIILEAAKSLGEILNDHSLILSIAAGQRIAPILDAIGAPSRGAIRAMPNTPAQIGKGFVALYFNEAVDAQQRLLGEKLMSVLGTTAIVEDENLLDAVTVLSGCGPAYLFYLAEILTEAGTRLGLDREWSQRATIATLAGAAALLEAEGDAAQLRAQVTSPNGVTQAALEILMANDALKSLFMRAFEHAHERSVQLGKR